MPSFVLLVDTSATSITERFQPMLQVTEPILSKYIDGSFSLFAKV